MAKHTAVLFGALAVAAAFAGGAWLAGARIGTPAGDAEAPAPILAPVEQRVLSSRIVARGKARFGLPQPVSIAPSPLKAGPGLIANLPVRGTQLKEGDVLLTASGRPLFILKGAVRAYRDLVPGIAGDDVRQLQQALRRLGFDPGPVDGRYDGRTSAAVGRWYKARGWEPFGPTREQLADVAALERDWGEAGKSGLAAAAAVSAANLNLSAAGAAAAYDDSAAAAELGAQWAAFQALRGPRSHTEPLALETERARAQYASRAAEAGVAASLAERALAAADPRQTDTARALATARLEAARAAVRLRELEGQVALENAGRALGVAAERVALAEGAVGSVRLQGQKAVQAALDAHALAAFELQFSSARFKRLTLQLARARERLGIQVPADEIVFTPQFPARVGEVTAAAGAAAAGPLMTITSNELVIDCALPVDTALLVKPGMAVAIDEPALGSAASGVVDSVASTPGTGGVDAEHVYCGVRVLGAAGALEGASLRLTIGRVSTGAAVTAVPVQALSRAADGTARVQVAGGGVLRYVAVTPGLAAEGYVAVTAQDGTLAPGQLVVVGYRQPRARAQ